jgi:hypothetical protein
MEIALRSLLMLQSSNLLKKGSLWKEEKQTETLIQKNSLKDSLKDLLKDSLTGLLKDSLTGLVKLEMIV